MSHVARLSSLRPRFLALALCLASAPASAALILTTGGTGLTPCGAQLCLDYYWAWQGETPESLGETPLTLPTPDPAQWALAGGTLRFYGDGGAGGWFDAVQVAQAGVTNEYNHLGTAYGRYLTFGADGALLSSDFKSPLIISCYTPIPTEGLAFCGDDHIIVGGQYLALPLDPAFSGPLTLRYDFALNVPLDPVTERYRVNHGGVASLVYSPVPEPGTALLVMAGLLGLAYPQRRHGCAGRENVEGSISPRALLPRFLALALCLVAGPSYALNLTITGGMSPCGANMCVEAGWEWTGETDEATGETTVTLPLPDPALWTLTGGQLRLSGGGQAYGWFDASQVPAGTNGNLAVIGRTWTQVMTFGADGEQISPPQGGGLLLICGDYQIDGLVRCGDGDALLYFQYSALPDDPALSGPLTIRYSFDIDAYFLEPDLEPVREYYRMEHEGFASLVYSPIPEPSTGILVMTGLLGLRISRVGAGAQRRVFARCCPGARS